MSKKQMKLIPVVVLLLGIVASVMVFLPALKYTDGNTSYTGIQIITGVDILNLGVIAEGKLPFSFLALLAFTLPIIAGFVAYSKSKNAIISVILFIGAAVLLFILPQYIVINVSVFGGGPTEVEVDWVLQVGAISAGVLSTIGALLSLIGISQK